MTVVRRVPFRALSKSESLSASLIARVLRVDMRTAAYALALERLGEVYKRRSIWP